MPQRECKHYKTLFERKPTRQIYCNDQCRQTYHVLLRTQKRRTDPVIRARDMERVRQHYHKKMMDPEHVVATRAYHRERERIRMQDPEYRKCKQEQSRINHKKRYADSDRKAKAYARQQAYRQTEEYKIRHAQHSRTRRRKKRTVDTDGIQDSVIYARDAWVCQSCGIDTHPYSLTGQDRKCHRRAGTIDHIVPLARGGTDKADNKQVMCRSCNSTKQDRLEEELALLRAS